MSDISGIQYNEPTENTSTNMIEQFDKEFVFDEDAEKLVMNYGEGNGITEATPKDIKAFILKSLKEQDKKHFFEMEELRLKEGGFRIKQHKIYDEKLKTQREKIIKEIEGMFKNTNYGVINNNTINNLDGKQGYNEALKDVINNLK